MVTNVYAAQQSSKTRTISIKQSLDNRKHLCISLLN